MCVNILSRLRYKEKKNNPHWLNNYYYHQIILWCLHKAKIKFLVLLQLLLLCFPYLLTMSKIRRRHKMYILTYIHTQSKVIQCNDSDDKQIHTIHTNDTSLLPSTSTTISTNCNSKFTTR